jgi:hypothetical protein
MTSGGMPMRPGLDAIYRWFVEAGYGSEDGSK